VEGLRRGDVLTVVLPGKFGKPRPAVLVQSDLLNPTHSTLLVCPITSFLEEALEFRVDIRPDAGNGLCKASQAMVDKVQAIKREKIGRVVGRLGKDVLAQIDRTLAVVIGLA
jgi:mRNA interferase MazF